MTTKITQAEEKLKKVSKNDILWLFKTIMNDNNLMGGGTINLLNAGYSKAQKHKAITAGEAEPIPTKALIVKMNLASGHKREYFEFTLIRHSKQNIVFHRSIARIEYIDNYTKTKKNA